MGKEVFIRINSKYVAYKHDVNMRGTIYGNRLLMGVQDKKNIRYYSRCHLQGAGTLPAPLCSLELTAICIIISMCPINLEVPFSMGRSGQVVT